MARKVILELTIPEADHLLYLLQCNEEAGFYSGNKQQYRDRAKSILKKFKDAMVWS